MRQFTEKEKFGFARAFQNFYKTLTGQTAKIDCYLPLIETALAEGIRMDELLNKENFSRAGNIIACPSAEEYINILSEKLIPVKTITEEEGWDESESLSLLSEIFHSFYIALFPQGGQYSSGRAKDLLRKAISRFTFQNILNEALIPQVASLRKIDPETLTCFQYILGVLDFQEELNLNKDVNSLSDEQLARMNTVDESAETAVREKPGEESEAETADSEAEEIELETEGAPETEDEENYDETQGITKEEYKALSTQEIKDEPDSDFDFMDKNFSEEKLKEESPEEKSDEKEENDPEEQTEEPLAFFSTIAVDPKKYKRNAIESIIWNYPLDEIIALASCIPNSRTLSDIVECLVNGNYNASLQTLEIRNIHQQMNGELINSFRECAGLLGFHVDNTMLSNFDLLIDDWDLRRPNARKLQKLKNLIYNYGEEDKDLCSAIEDLTKLYFDDEES